VPGDASSAMPRAWTRRCVTQQGPQFARTEGLFFFVRDFASLLPSSDFLAPSASLFSSPSMVPFAETYSGVRVALAPSRRAFGCEAADRCRYTLAHLRSTESRIEQEASHQIPPITSLVDTWAFKGMTMINGVVFENELFSHYQSTTVASARRTRASGREGPGPRTEQFKLSRNAV
jgi:hypothetical protein